MEQDLYLKKNLNSIHRVIRVLIGVALIAWAAISFTSAWWIAIVAALGGTQIIEGLIGYWVVLDMLGWSTLRTDRAEG